MKFIISSCVFFRVMSISGVAPPVGAWPFFEASGSWVVIVAWGSRYIVWLTVCSLWLSRSERLFFRDKDLLLFLVLKELWLGRDLSISL